MLLEKEVIEYVLIYLFLYKILISYILDVLFANITIQIVYNMFLMILTSVVGSYP